MLITTLHYAGETSPGRYIYIQLLISFSFGLKVQKNTDSHYTVEHRFTDTSLILIPCYYGQFSLSLGKASPHIFSKFNSLNTDSFYASSVSVFSNGV